MINDSHEATISDHSTSDDGDFSSSRPTKNELKTFLMSHDETNIANISDWVTGVVESHDMLKHSSLNSKLRSNVNDIGHYEQVTINDTADTKNNDVIDVAVATCSRLPDECSVIASSGESVPTTNGFIEADSLDLTNAIPYDPNKDDIMDVIMAFNAVSDDTKSCCKETNRSSSEASSLEIHEPLCKATVVNQDLNSATSSSIVTQTKSTQDKDDANWLVLNSGISENGTFLCGLCDLRFTTSDFRKKHRHESHATDTNTCQCYFCGQTFATIDGLYKHMKVHKKKTKKYECTLCSETFDAKILLKKHIMLHKLQCQVCSETFPKKKLLQRHMAAHKHQCPKCTDTFPTKVLLKEHVKSHKHQCPECSETFSRKKLLKKHLTSHKYKCPDCSETFSKKALFKKHKTSHKHQCPECIESFPKRTLLEIHRALHAQKRQDSAKTFPDEPLLQTQMTLHKHKCPECIGTFAKKTLLQAHILASHRHKCTACNGIFPSKTLLEEHKSLNIVCSHARESGKPDRIALALSQANTGNSFSESDRTLYPSAKKNKGICENGQFSCKECDLRFTTRYFLNKHELCHDDFKPFRCYFCQWKFASKDILEKHVLDAH